MSSARAPLMEGSDNNATSSPAGDVASRRRSGRVVRAPQKFGGPASKRKRGAEHDDDDEDEENELPDYAENWPDEDDDNDDVIDDEDDGEASSRKRKNKKPSSSSQATRAKKPAAKKPKINGASLPSRRKEPNPNREAWRHEEGERREGDELYHDVLYSGDAPEDIAGRWYGKYQQDTTAAVRDLVNCILLATGCKDVVSEDDINDPDNCSNRLTELQELFEDQQITEYPLTSRQTGKHVRDSLVGFCKCLINVLHETDTLYQDAPLMENIVRWVASMSSSTLRPFRHTATTVALGMLYALVEVGKKLDDRVTKMTQQVEGETARVGKKKDKASREKLSKMQQTLDEANQNRELCGEQMKEFFDTVFVHRYRDVDPKIRTECVEALGSWIWVLPNVYREPEYLRYLGWMLSDTVPATRHEVLKQLVRVFKRDAEKLGHFIDRFRPRLVEMAIRDADIGVRVTAVSVVENLRSSGMLEPDEIDSIGRLIFDSELRIRKAVVPFFAACVADLVESKKEDIGGNEAMEELRDSKTLQKGWLQVKCLAETLAAYEAQLGDENSDEAAHGLEVDAEMVNAAIPETRISLAAQVLYEKMTEISKWKVLADYLLHDHSVSTKSKSRAKSRSTEAIFRSAVAPEGQEESILLEVLSSAVSQAPLRRAQRLDDEEAPQDDGYQLATMIPDLLRKFGAEPDTATVVLRLEHHLNLDVFQQLRQDPTTYSRLLDEICTQFNRHSDKGVLSEATQAILHARRHEELREVIDEKVSLLWENILNSLRNFDKTCELSERGNLDPITATELSNVLLKISKLTTVADCIDVLEAEGTSQDSSSSAIELLVHIVHRGKFEQPDEDRDAIEDELTGYAIRSCKVYLMWKKRSLEESMLKQQPVPDLVADQLVILRKRFQVNLVHTLSSRAFNDDLRLAATGCLCDMACLYGSLKPLIEQPANAQRYRSLKGLIQEIHPGLTNELISIFDGAERSFAKKARKTLNEPADDEDPLDDEQLSDDEDDVEGLSPAERKTAELKAEHALCELTSQYVMTILAKMVDHSGPHAGKLKRRLLRNQAKLGNNFKAVVSFLDESKLPELMTGKKASAKAKGKQPVAGGGAKAAQPPAKSAAIVTAEDDEDDPFASPEPEEGTEEDLRRRELLDDPIEEPEDDDDAAANEGGAAIDDDDILGD